MNRAGAADGPIKCNMAVLHHSHEMPGRQSKPDRGTSWCPYMPHSPGPSDRLGLFAGDPLVHRPHRAMGSQTCVLVHSFLDAELVAIPLLLDGTLENKCKPERASLRKLVAEM
jgi:hypothetical protein